MQGIINAIYRIDESLFVRFLDCLKNNGIVSQTFIDRYSGTSLETRKNATVALLVFASDAMVRHNEHEYHREYIKRLYDSLKEAF